MKTQTILGQKARSALMRGADEVYNPVAATIGGKGRNSVFDDWQLVVTNDGVSIARRINPENQFEKMGADLIKQSAEKTNEEAGDGTTTTIILARTIAQKGFAKVKNGADPMSVRRELLASKDIAIGILKDISIPVDDSLFNVAKISVEDDNLAKIVSDAVSKAGKYGNVVVDESSGYDIEKSEVQGYFWDKGFISSYMVTNPDKMESELNDCAVVVTDRTMNLNRELMPVLTELHQKGIKSLLVIAEKVEGELLQTLITNKMKGLFTTVVVRKPATQDELEDIAVLTGATAVTSDKGIKDINYSHLGTAKKVIVKNNETIIISDDSQVNPGLTLRVAQLQKNVDDKPEPLPQSRLAKLTKGVVILRVGAKTEAERKYLKLKIDDAVGACRSALAEGVVPGGGVSLAMVAERLGPCLLSDSLTAPSDRILLNAGLLKKETWLTKVLALFFGSKKLSVEDRMINIMTGERLDDMISNGITDPTKVERCAIENAVSFASTLLTIESAIIVTDEKA